MSLPTKQPAHNSALTNCSNPCAKNISTFQTLTLTAAQLMSFHDIYHLLPPVTSLHEQHQNRTHQSPFQNNLTKARAMVNHNTLHCGLLTAVHTALQRLEWEVPSGHPKTEQSLKPTQCKNSILINKFQQALISRCSLHPDSCCMCTAKVPEHIQTPSKPHAARKLLCRPPLNPMNTMRSLQLSALQRL